jgi:hypothetical protein
VWCRALAPLCHVPRSRTQGKGPWWAWQRLCALTLCTTSLLLYLLASLCLATGFFHRGTPSQAHHHHGPGTHQPSRLPDICDFAQQALTTTVVAPVPLLPSVLSPGETLLRPLRFALLIERVNRHGSRAPPLVHA